MVVQTLTGGCFVPCVYFDAVTVDGDDFDEDASLEIWLGLYELGCFFIGNTSAADEVAHDDAEDKVEGDDTEEW